MTLTHIHSGKVRDLYEVDDRHLLMVASDRVSVFDVILPDRIRDKGRVLTAMSTFWFEQSADVFENHFVSSDPADFPRGTPSEFAGRAMLVRRTDPVKLECIVRGYLFGHGWDEYAQKGTVNGAPLPPGLRQAERLDHPIFTPTTKADVGGHDEALTRRAAMELVGAPRFEACEAAALAVYGRGVEIAARAGVLIADTKFEFGMLDGALLLIDEVLTPDSSRYWPVDRWKPGTAPPSLDKQTVRDWSRSTGWDGRGDPPRVPAEVAERTRRIYVDLYERLTGRRFADWYGG